VRIASSLVIAEVRSRSARSTTVTLAVPSAGSRGTRRSVISIVSGATIGGSGSARTGPAEISTITTSGLIARSRLQGTGQRERQCAAPTRSRSCATVTACAPASPYSVALVHGKPFVGSRLRGMRSPLIVLSSCLALTSACGKTSAGAGGRVEGRPVETRPPEARGQKPAFPGQTRAPLARSNVAYDTTVLASGLEHPWSLAFLPDGSMLVTERPGRLRILTSGGAMSPPVGGLPPVDARDQGGLLDVVLDPAFDDNQRIYWSYAEPRDGGNGTAVARGRLVRDASPQLENVEVIWRQKPTLDSTKHFGSRLVFAKDGTLFITLGERSIPEGRKQAQSLDSHFGKIVRINPDGSIPQDNPFRTTPGALPDIYSLGHRNVQAAALHPQTGELWEIEHGTRGGDEINIVRPGKNYGWPTIAYGIEYQGGPIGKGRTQAPGLEQPIYYWDPVIAPSGMAFYTASMFPAWRGNLFVGGLAAKHVARLVLDGERVVGEERLLVDRARFRDVRVGPDGALYLLTDEDKGELLKLVPRAERAPQTGRAD
jgi:glucose/arabinose dehydrogenase